MRNFLLLLLFLPLISCDPKLDVDELTVALIHESFEKGEFTSEELVRAYIERIEKQDKAEGINSIILINPKAIEQARQLDAEFRDTGTLRPLHGIPVIVKDNYITEGLQTTAGSIALEGFVPASNAYQVQKMIDAGAVVLAKSNMAEWAFSPMHTEGSLIGTTTNPYNQNHVPAGSSGGTAAAVASNFGTLGLGTDTGNSIRGPSGHNALVGFRSTLGLTSREGIVPLYLRNDVGGPMCRTVEDATRVLDVIAGFDAKDPITSKSEGNIPDSYLSYLQEDGLDGARIGIIPQMIADIHPQVSQLFEQALSDMVNAGAEVMDVNIQAFDSLRRGQWCNDFARDVNQFLETYTGDNTVKTVEDILEVGGMSEFVRGRLERALASPGRANGSPCLDPYVDERRIAFRDAIEAEMDRLNLDAIVYPSWNYPPARIDKFAEEYLGDNSQIIAPHTGQPAFTVPMGFTQGGLPAGLQFLGRMYAEPTLIKLTYGYERRTRHRKVPGFRND